jgi:hypothetical protein
MPFDWGQIWDDYGDAITTVAGGYLEGQGAKDAADASIKGNNAAIAEQRRQFDTIMGIQQPYQQAGTQALNEISRLFGYAPSTPISAPGAAPNSLVPTSGNPNGLSSSGGHGRGLGAIGGAFATGNPFAVIPALLNRTTDEQREAFMRAVVARTPLGQQQTANAVPGTPGIGDMTGAGAPQQPTGLDVFQASPDYAFRRNEGTRGIENGLSARGGAFSGNALRALSEFNSDLASQEFGNYFNRRAAVAGIGQTATNNASNAAQNTGANVSNLLSANGDARASGVAGQTNALTGTIADLLSTWNRNRTPKTGSPFAGGSW